jgi:RHS repeat-associated protein
VSRAGPDNQCFRYDYLQRLTQAWTPTGACSAGPDKTSLGGPAPYWSSYGYDATGNRTSETQHGVGAVAADTTRTYHYPDPGQGQHRLSSVTQTGAAGSRTDSYGYDADGNTTTRDIGNADQTLSWDTEGHLATTADSTGSTSYAYDADGNRLLRRDPTSTTVYLPNMELRLDKTTGAVAGTRYYDHGGSLVAVGTAGGIQFQSADPHGTAELSISGSTQALAQRRFTPFGQFRGSPTGIWPTDKGFVGGTIDPSGLINLGARQYDPDTGRFISVDPLFDLTDPQSWNGYTYSDNNPATKSDPDGEGACVREPGSSGCRATDQTGTVRDDNGRHTALPKIITTVTTITAARRSSPEADQYPNPRSSSTSPRSTPSTPRVRSRAGQSTTTCSTAAPAAQTPSRPNVPAISAHAAATSAAKCNKACCMAKPVATSRASVLNNLPWTPILRQLRQVLLGSGSSRTFWEKDRRGRGRAARLVRKKRLNLGRISALGVPLEWATTGNLEQPIMARELCGRPQVRRAMPTLSA